MTLPMAYPNTNYWVFMNYIEDNAVDRTSPKIRIKTMENFVCRGAEGIPMFWYARNWT